MLGTRGHHHHESRYRRETVGMIFQLHNLIARLTARQNVEIAMFGTGCRAGPGGAGRGAVG